MLLFDPQTSGGLLFAIAPEMVVPFEMEAAALDLPLWRVGEVTATGFVEVV